MKLTENKMSDWGGWGEEVDIGSKIFLLFFLLWLLKTSSVLPFLTIYVIYRIGNFVYDYVGFISQEGGWWYHPQK